MLWMMDEFIRLEDEDLVSTYRFDEKTHMFFYGPFVFILNLVWAQSKMFHSKSYYMI